MDRKESLRVFFEPRGVAVVGARHNPGFGYGIPLTLKKNGWEDRLYLVNPKGGELHGLPVYRSVTEVPDPVDLAIVIVPAPVVPEVLEEIGERGIRHAIVETAGFAEVGEAGRLLQEKARAVAARYGIRVIGPNCVGVVNTRNRFTTVEIVDEAFTPGPTAIIAQSGVFGNVLLDLLYEFGLFISKAITLGNRMDVNECEVLDYLHHDQDTQVIMIYLEGAADGRLLKETLARVTCDKPVLILKSGRTSAGRSATASHTASLSGEDDLYDALFAQTGVIRALNLEELVETARVFATQPLPRGNRLGIVTSSGSLGVMATDTAVASGLELPPLSPSTVEWMRAEAPEWMNVKNPLDVGPSNQYTRALEAMMQDPHIDMVLAIAIIPFVFFRDYMPLGLNATLWFGDFVSIRKLAPQKPLAVCATGNSKFVAHMRKACGPTVPVFISPEPAARALASLYRYKRWREKLPPAPYPPQGVEDCYRSTQAR
jgi:acyl-CoA synthetase (NDP forming)